MPVNASKFVPKAIRNKVGSSEFKAKMRDMKNQVLDYTEAEMLVREATCNSPDPPVDSQFRAVAKYTRTADWPSVVAIISKRLQAKNNANHPYKCMLLIESLLQETSGPDRERVWRDLVLPSMVRIDELRHFEIVVDNVEQGFRVRPVAQRIVDNVRAEQRKRDDDALGLPPSSKAATSHSFKEGSSKGDSGPAGGHRRTLSSPEAETSKTAAAAVSQQQAAPKPAPAAPPPNLLDDGPVAPDKEYSDLLTIDMQGLGGGGGSQEPFGVDMRAPGQQNASADPFGGAFGGQEAAPPPQQAATADPFGGAFGGQEAAPPPQQAATADPFGGAFGGQQATSVLQPAQQQQQQQQDDPFGGVFGGMSVSAPPQPAQPQASADPFGGAFGDLQQPAAPQQPVGGDPFGGAFGGQQAPVTQQPQVPAMGVDPFASSSLAGSSGQMQMQSNYPTQQPPHHQQAAADPFAGLA